MKDWFDFVETGKEMELVGGLEVFNNYENSRHLGQVKAAKVSTNFLPS